MSVEKYRKESKRWLDQAEADLRAAGSSRTTKNFEWSCFQAHQSAEKAMKAIWLYHQFDPWGHSVIKLIEEFPERKIYETRLKTLLKEARHLDKLYIPTRYPNGLPELSPFQVFGEEDAVDGIEAARKILETIKANLAF